MSPLFSLSMSPKYFTVQVAWRFSFIRSVINFIYLLFFLSSLLLTFRCPPDNYIVHLYRQMRHSIVLFASWDETLGLDSKRKSIFKVLIQCFTCCSMFIGSLAPMRSSMVVNGNLRACFRSDIGEFSIQVIFVVGMHHVFLVVLSFRQHLSTFEYNFWINLGAPLQYVLSLYFISNTIIVVIRYKI